LIPIQKERVFPKTQIILHYKIQLWRRNILIYSIEDFIAPKNIASISQKISAGCKIQINLASSRDFSLGKNVNI